MTLVQLTPTWALIHQLSLAILLEAITLTLQEKSPIAQINPTHKHTPRRLLANLRPWPLPLSNLLTSSGQRPITVTQSLLYMDAEAKAQRYVGLQNGISHPSSLTRYQFADELFEEKTSLGLNLRQTFPSCKWVFPSSQERYSTVFQEALDEWFDIYSLTDPAAREELQVEGLHDSIMFLQALISNEAMPSDRVILLGLSQGSATGAYYVAPVFG